MRINAVLPFLFVHHQHIWALDPSPILDNCLWLVTTLVLQQVKVSLTSYNPS